jgi:ABC-type polysaccharide/polyol phosphate export permease
MESIIEAENIIKSSPLNLNHVFLRITIRNFITFFHNFIIIFFLVIFFSKNIFIFLISIPLFVLSYFIILFPIGGILAILATRFRDVNSMVNSLIQVIFLSSPIIWHPTLIQGDMFKYLIELNPIYHFLEIFRSPIFYNLFPWKSYLIIILIGIALNIIFLYLYNKKKNQIIFWI